MTMYCSGCGTQIQSELNYCNRCGSKVAKGESTSAAENLSQAVGYVGLFGLVAYIFVVLVLVKSNVETAALVMISFIYLAALFGICFMLIRQTAMFTKKKPALEPKSEDAAPHAYLRPVTTAQLEEPRDTGIGSITEHTTRALDAVPVERE